MITRKKINQDQKAQAEKKPSLKASLSQLEEQIKQYQQFDEDYQKRLAEEKSVLESSHKDELQKLKDATAAEAAATSEKESKDKLLILSKFLRAAAAKRQGGDENSAENRAFEGALLLVYGGEASAVVAMESLIAGVEEKVPTVDQNPSEFTCKCLCFQRSLSQNVYANTDFLQTSKSAILLSNMLLMLLKRLGLRKLPNPNLFLQAKRNPSLP